MSPLHLYLNLERLTILVQDEFKFEFSPSALACSTPIMTRSNSSSSSLKSEGHSSNFSFSAAYEPTHDLHNTQSAYADEIFYNGKIRPLLDHRIEAITQLSLMETQQGAAYCASPRAPPPSDNDHCTSEPALGTPASPPSHNDDDQHTSHEHARAAQLASSPSPNHAVSSDPHPLNESMETAQVALNSSDSDKPSSKVVYRRAFSNFLPLRRVFHAEEECLSPSRVKAASVLNGVPHLKKATAFAHHYNTQRSSKESTTKQTFLPYRRGILACIGY